MKATVTPIWFNEQPASISDTALAPDGQLGALALDNRDLMMLDADSNIQYQYELKENNPQLLFRPDANRRQGTLVVRAEDHVRLLSYRGKQIKDKGQYPAVGKEAPLNDAAFSPDASLLLLAGEEITFYASDSGDWLGNLPVISGANNVAINRVSFSQDGKWLLVISGDVGEVRLYSVAMKSN